jgi:hypothetical protein
MSIIILPDCPTDCTGVLESVSFSECAPEVHFGEIAKLYLWVDSATPPFASQAQYDSVPHWNTHLNQSGVAVDDIREFTVIGEMPEPEQTETPISGDRTVIGYKKFTLNLEIDETNETNYNFLLASECNGKYKCNFETADGILYGGYLGLDVSVKMNQVIPRSRQEVVKIMVKITWSSKNHPFRQISLLA